jgi:hypothetical protein
MKSKASTTLLPGMRIIRKLCYVEWKKKKKKEEEAPKSNVFVKQC